jgi:hypothetical protein
VRSTRARASSASRVIDAGSFEGYGPNPHELRNHRHASLHRLADERAGWHGQDPNLA